MGCCICPGLDPGQDPPAFEDGEEFIPVIGTIGEHSVHRVLLATVLLDLIQEWREHPVVRHGFLGDLDAENLVGLDVDHRMDFDPATSDFPLLPYPFAPVGDFNPGTVNGDDDVPGKELWSDPE